VARLKWDPKDPGDDADYWLSLVTALAPTGAVLESVVVTPPDEPDGITLSQPADILDNVVRTRFTGGKVGTYKINYTFTLDTGETFNADAILTVKERVVK